VQFHCCLQVLGEYDVDPSQVLSLHNQILQSKLMLETDSLNTELETLAASYKAFLQECNAIDLADVYLAVQSGCATNAELKEKLSGTNFLIVNPQFHSAVEVDF